MESWPVPGWSIRMRGAVALVVLACLAAPIVPPAAYGQAIPLTGLPAPAVGQTLAQGYESKAEMLYNVAKFIQWPRRAFRTDSQFVFAILGEDPLAEMLPTAMAGKTIAGRPVFVRFVQRIKDLEGSQIAYIALSEEKRLDEALGALNGKSILTVADFQDFTGRGGMVDFAEEQGHVRFEIQRERAEKAGLKISSKLLAIARLVEPEN